MSKTPKLRFKEFSGDWESKKLGNISEIYDGTHQTPKYTDNGVKFVSVENINNIYEGNKYISEEDYNKNFKIKPQINDIFMTRITAGEIGATAIVDRKEKLAYYVSVALIRAYNKKVNSLFLTKYIASKYFKKELNKRIIHVAFPKKINLGDIGECGVNLPKLEEQEKIASFFSLIDEKISLQGQKVEALKDYKKGMTQKIFSRELRFKDDEGRDYPEWEEKKLGDCIDTITDYVAAGSFATIRENVQYKNNKDYAQLIRTVDLKNKFKNDDNFIYVDKNAFEFLYRVNLDEESIILPNVGNVGEVYFVNPENLPNEKNVLAPNSILLRSYKNDNAFLYQLFNTKKFRDSLDIITSKSGQPKFNKTELKEIKLNIPIRQEQIKISKFLKNIDFKIEREQEKLDSLNQYKKGLLQQMFV